MTRNTPGSEYLRGGKDPYPTRGVGFALEGSVQIISI